MIPGLAARGRTVIRRTTAAGLAVLGLVGCSPAADPLFTPAPGSPIALGDVNGDGKPDVAASNLESDTVTVLLGR
jgi:hypothetical protein